MYRIDQIKEPLALVIKTNLTDFAWEWLKEKGNIENLPSFYSAFALIPRKTGKGIINITPEQQDQLAPLYIQNWSIDRLCRIWLLTQLNSTSKEKYFTTIENLFDTAEMNELVALYSALPILEHPEMWKKRCAEGIRSNIGTVLEAIMYHNIYPSENLDEDAWNQLIMKAFFTDKQLSLIIGIEKRNNSELVRILIDFAKERWAAGREVDPYLWFLVGKFVNEKTLQAMKSGDWQTVESH